VEAYLKPAPPACDLTFVIEGEEEVGSANLDKFLKANRKELQCEAVVISDTGMPSPKTSGTDLCPARIMRLNSGAWSGRTCIPAFLAAGGKSRMALINCCPAPG